MPNQKQSPLGEISAIRDILMGEQMQDYEHRFQQLLDRAAAMEQAFNKQLNELEKRRTEALQAFQEATEKRLASLEQQLAHRTGELEERIRAVSDADRVNLGKMLRELGQQLTGDGQ
ncbi:MAG: hypothetical protein KDC66_10135 [Phaeodactylibacter sp.]|nr:hypothetical protein [Phaeodactylibacter sp.]MCB9276331.1 hypothetical protein [Lewinellaceae bacterium]